MAENVLYRDENSRLFDDIKYGVNSNSPSGKKIIESIGQGGGIPCGLVTKISTSAENLNGLERFKNLKILDIYSNADLGSIGGKLENLKRLTIYGCTTINASFNYRQMAKIAPNVENIALIELSYENRSEGDLHRISYLELVKKSVDDFIATKGDPSWSDQFKRYLYNAKATQSSRGALDIDDIAYFRNLKTFCYEGKIKEIDLLKFPKLEFVHINGASKVKGLKYYLQGDVTFDSYGEIESLEIKNPSFLLKGKGKAVLNVLNYFDIFSKFDKNEIKGFLCNNISFVSGQGTSLFKKYPMTEFYEKITPIIDMADTLCADCDSQFEKLNAIYSYCRDNFIYAKDIASSKKDNIFDLFKSKQGVCNTFSEFFAFMCLSQGIDMHMLTASFATLAGDEKKILGGGHALNYMVLFDNLIVFDVTNNIWSKTIQEYLNSMNEIKRKRNLNKRINELKKETPYIEDEEARIEKENELESMSIEVKSNPEEDSMMFLAVNEEEIVKNYKERQARQSRENIKTHIEDKANV